MALTELAQRADSVKMAKYNQNAEPITITVFYINCALCFAICTVDLLNAVQGSVLLAGTMRSICDLRMTSLYSYTEQCVGVSIHRDSWNSLAAK